MPAFVALLLAGFRSLLTRFFFYVAANLPAIAGNVLIALGFYFVVAKPVATFGIEYIMSKFNGVPGTVLETLYYLNMDDYVQIVMAAYAARKTMDAGRVALKKRA